MFKIRLWAYPLSPDKREDEQFCVKNVCKKYKECILLCLPSFFTGLLPEYFLLVICNNILFDLVQKL